MATISTTPPPSTTGSAFRMPPIAATMIPIAATAGQNEPAGTWTGSGGTAGTGVIPFSAHSGVRLRTSGMTEKL